MTDHGDSSRSTVPGLRFGLILQTELRGDDRDTASRVAEIREQARLARAVGFDGVGLGHHHSIGLTQRLHPMVLGSALASDAEGMDLATLVYLSGQYQPLEVAEQIASLDAVWGGRLKLGLAPGWVREEFRALGIPYASRLQRFLESLDLMKQLWSGRAVDGPGEFFDLDGVQLRHLPVQRPHPTVWLGATKPRAAARVGELEHPYLLSGHPRISDLVEPLQTYRDVIDRRGYSPGDQPILRNCFVADTDARAVELAAPHIRESYQGFAKWDLFDEVLGEGATRSDVEAEASSLDIFRDDRVMLGSVASLRSQLQDLIDRLGVNYVFMRLQWPGLSNDHVLKAIEVMGRDVLPFVQAPAYEKPS